MSFNLSRNFFKHVDFCVVGVSDLHTLKHVNHPPGSLSAWSALAATLVLVEVGETEDSVDNVSLLIHYDDSGSSETTPSGLEIIEVHDSFTAFFLIEHGHGGTSGDDGLEVVPSSDDSTAMPIDEFSEWNTHFLLDSTRVVDMPTNAEQLGTGVALSSE